MREKELGNIVTLNPLKDKIIKLRFFDTKEFKSYYTIESKTTLMIKATKSHSITFIPITSIGNIVRDTLMLKINKLC